MERWKDIVSKDNPAALDNMTFLEFMFKLDREIQAADAKVKELEKLKHKHGK